MVGEDVAHRPGGAVSLAVGMAFIFSNIPGLDHLMNYWYHFCIMFEALFIMTIIDAGTRVGRYMLQELIGRVWPKFGDPHWLPGGIVASALISGAWGYIVLQGNLSTIWPIFGVSNQLLAIITLAISTVVICAMGKARFAWVTVIPWVFLTVVIFWLITSTCSTSTCQAGMAPLRRIGYHGHLGHHRQRSLCTEMP